MNGFILASVGFSEVKDDGVAIAEFESEEDMLRVIKNLNDTCFKNRFGEVKIRH